MSALVPVPTFACRLLTGELLAIDDSHLYALHPTSHKVVASVELATCDDARVEHRRGAGAAAVDRVLVPLAPLLTLVLAFAFPGGRTALTTGVLVAVTSWLAMLLSRRQVTPVLVLRRGGTERVLALAHGGGHQELWRAARERVSRRPRPIANLAELAAAEERVRRYTLWSGNRLGAGK